MSRPGYVGRFAPSPTGRMHLGVARTFLAAWLDARAAGGRIILRIEDVDRDRIVPGAAQGLIEDLEWLGLDWDEGPGHPGPHAPYFQSERSARYEARLLQLEALGRVYPCTCSRREIALASSAPHGANDEGPRYPGTCRDGARPRPGRSPSIRFRTEPHDRVTFVDRLRGRQEEDVHAAVGDFISRRSDGLWAYQFAVTVDDLEQGVTHVVRGADLLGSTARQVLLRRVLDPEAPAIETLHIPLVLGPTGDRLAKRDGAIAVADRRAQGFSPETLIGELARSLGQFGPLGEVGHAGPIRARELVPLWAPEKIPLRDTKLEDIERR